ncbi:MAG TPA: hypothetical protein VFS21_39370 [Roseiflexaceae bacterium]|nr:hypothetical protein [Roseiflexaceae bacterium]
MFLLLVGATLVALGGISCVAQLALHFTMPHQAVYPHSLLSKLAVSYQPWDRSELALAPLNPRVAEAAERDLRVPTSMPGVVPVAVIQPDQPAPSQVALQPTAAQPAPTGAPLPTAPLPTAAAPISPTLPVVAILPSLTPEPSQPDQPDRPGDNPSPVIPLPTFPVDLTPPVATPGATSGPLPPTVEPTVDVPTLTPEPTDDPEPPTRIPPTPVPPTVPPTVTPTATPTASPTTTPTATPTATGTPTATPTPSVTPTPSITPTPSATPAVIACSRVKITPIVHVSTGAIELRLRIQNSNAANITYLNSEIRVEINSGENSLSSAVSGPPLQAGSITISTPTTISYMFGLNGTGQISDGFLSARYHHTGAANTSDDIFRIQFGVGSINCAFSGSFPPIPGAGSGPAVTVEIVNPASDNTVLTARSQGTFEARATTGGAGGINGQGISWARFQITELGGNTPIWTWTEYAPTYCVFSTSTPGCGLPPIGWWNGLEDGPYRLDVIARSFGGVFGTASRTFLVER